MALGTEWAQTINTDPLYVYMYNLCLYSAIFGILVDLSAWIEMGKYVNGFLEFNK